jgi:hypothetical protein
MLTILPCVAVMKAVTDNNIDSVPSKYRRIAFDNATELQSISARHLTKVFNSKIKIDIYGKIRNNRIKQNL